MRVLLTGSSGFVGKAVLNSRTPNAVTFYKASRAVEASDARDIPLGDGLWSVDTFKRAIAISEPDLIIHCAGVVGESQTEALFAANVTLAANLFKAVTGFSPSTRVMVIGSASEYGLIPASSLPVSENFPCKPHTNYGISKYAQTLISLAASSNGIRSLVVRLFNPVGLGMPKILSLPSFATRIAAASPGDRIKVGNIDVSRDFIEVNEAARIILSLGILSEWPWPVVNLCSGTAVSLSAILDRLIHKSGKDLQICIDPTMIRSVDLQAVYGCTERLKSVGLFPSFPDIDALSSALITEASVIASTRQ